ncbi:lipoprotein [Burkholderia pseudomallei]|uniref:LPS translocon maturation chaperone LptM n=1 Tax=Burkholderia TaxID=32008 RepID=UPI0003D8DAEB|nr:MULTISPECIES: lipoprotein [Burkholderia]KGX75271.1 prokaryotic lipo-attachment site family protein [Burkholderia pseudomallei MSHR435]AHE32546.1 prokaryotic lipo-attachment site family protein [Burkholderia pseudomallei NAU20B-16]AHG35615.1 prokaryotic lipo-attachment site family protein [Burkholderia pseudomallei MSHR511]AHG67993.1 prokaryotic lipo-attachment site family protein [Burkholderia pseudomallei MSHR146]AJX22971.1 prokaryotic lipo-attachment site family protein [Burkholderia pseu
MRIVLQMSAIVAALALAGCGQRGPLYMPVVPPLPPKPTEQTQPPPSDVTPDAETASARDDGASGAADAPLTLSPDLSTQRAPKAAPASGASSAQ